MPATGSAEAGSPADEPGDVPTASDADRKNEQAQTDQAASASEADKAAEAGQPGKGETETPQPAAAVSRVISVLDGRRLDIKGRPLIGSPAAKHVLVELFDYTCVHCRTLHKNLHQVQSLYGEQLAVLTLPLPLNAQCNSAVVGTSYVHRDACDLARCALAVWRRKPEAFPQYHNWLMGAPNGRTPAEARARAAQLIGQDMLRQELGGTVLDVYFEQHAGLYRRANKGALPQLMSSAFTLKGEVGFAELCRLLEEKLHVRRTSGGASVVPLQGR